jgi:3-methyladenine DNA glycosylase AlkC
VESRESGATMAMVDRKVNEQMRRDNSSKCKDNRLFWVKKTKATFKVFSSSSALLKTEE